MAAANLIAVGRVIEVIDRKPSAQSRKRREAHWVEIETTLKGSDEAGERFRVRPNGAVWRDGQSYVLFLDWRGGDWAEAMPQPVLEATAKNVASVRTVVAARGEQVTPRRILWLRNVSGGQAQAATEFIVTEDGAFLWSNRVAPKQVTPSGYEILEGMLPLAMIADLLKEIALTPPGQVVDDAGMLTLHWRDDRGRVRFRSYYRPDQPPASDILRRIEALARTNP